MAPGPEPPVPPNDPSPDSGELIDPKTGKRVPTRDMRETGHGPEDGWKAVERDHAQLALAAELLAAEIRLFHLEAPAGHPDLSGFFEPDVFIGMLEESERE